LNAGKLRIQSRIQARRREIVAMREVRESDLPQVKKR